MSENIEHAAQPQNIAGPGIWQVFVQMTHGVALGYLHKQINLIEMRTFITNEMLKGNQVELSKQLEDKFNIHVVRKSRGE